MIVSSTDTIPGKKIVKVLGTIHTQKPIFSAIVSPKMAEKNLEKQAEKMGANAIVGFKVEEMQLRRVRTVRQYTAYGTAVIVEDEK